MYGFSYQGMTQLLAAAEAPEGLLCIAPAQTAHDLYRGWFYQNGALRLASTLGWGLQMLKADARRLGLREASDRLERAWANLPAQSLETPYAGHPAIHGEGLPTYVRDWLEHDRPDDYWAAQDVSQTPLPHPCPRPASLRLVRHLPHRQHRRLRRPDGAARPRPTPASTNTSSPAPGFTSPGATAWARTASGPKPTLTPTRFTFAGSITGCKDSGEFADEPRIRHFALDFGTGKGRWHSAERWPGPESPALTLFLHSAGRANSSKGDGTLLPAAPIQPEPPDIFVYDPEVPVPAPGGLINGPGPSNQAALELGNNVLVYTSETLAVATHVFGSPIVELHCATSAPCADLTAKLILLRPSGEAIFLAIGIARSSFLFPDYTADTPHLWRFRIAPTSCLFSAEDRIRIEIASSAYPLFDRNSSNATPPRFADSWNWQRSTQLLFHDPGHPSCIRLPVLAEQRA